MWLWDREILQVSPHGSWTRNINLKGTRMKLIVSWRGVLFTVALCAMLCSTGSYAQRSRISLDERVKYLTEQLSLTQTQADSVRKIYETAEKDRMAAFQAHKDDRAAVRGTVGNIMKDADDKVGALLTPDQKAKYDKIKKERPRMMMGGPQSKQKKDQGDKNQ